MIAGKFEIDHHSLRSIIGVRLCIRDDVSMVRNIIIVYFDIALAGDYGNHLIACVCLKHLIVGVVACKNI